MAAYAALVSLMNNIEQIQNHPRLSTSLDKKQIESLGKKVGFFLDFMESYNYPGGSKDAEELESQIASAAHAAEDLIESHIVDQILAGSTEKSPSFLLDLQKIIQDMDSIKEEVMKDKEERGFKDQQPTYPMPAASSRHLTTGKNTMVGFDGHLNQLMDVLTGQQSSRQIISIIGMGGIDILETKGLLDKFVIVKFNGSLGTKIGFNDPKCVMEIGGGLTCLDLIINQIEAVNAKYECNIPVFLVNAVNAHRGILKFLEKHPDKNIHSVAQSSHHLENASNFARLSTKGQDNKDEMITFIGSGSMLSNKWRRSKFTLN